MTPRHARLEAETILSMSGCGASGAMWAALGALLLHADANGRCYPSLSTLEKVAGLTRRTLTRSLKSLENRGVIGRDRHGRTPTHYIVLLGAYTPLEVGTQPPLEVGASEVTTRDESVPELGAYTPPELKVLNTDNNKVFTAVPSDLSPAGSVVTPQKMKNDRLCAVCGGFRICDEGDGAGSYACGVCKDSDYE